MSFDDKLRLYLRGGSREGPAINRARGEVLMGQLTAEIDRLESMRKQLADEMRRRNQLASTDV